ncbi:MAG: thiol peroxidase [Candidatus Promineifilaceae bacterium]|nr:thiol peroxidase [Candidatus Promineifilaceae bacterium]
MNDSARRSITDNGRPLTVLGRKLRVGETAPDFKLVDGKLRQIRLSDSAGKVRLLFIVPALVTPVCDTQTKRVNELAAELGEEAAVYTISAEHPWNQFSWCMANDDSNIRVLSDHRDVAFGRSYGVLIDELRLLQRAVFVIDAKGNIVYADYVPDIADLPDFEQPLSAAKEAIKEAA